MRTQLLFGRGESPAAAVASILSHIRFAPTFAIVSRSRSPAPRRKFFEYEFGHDLNATIAVLFFHRIGRQNDYLQTLHRNRQRVRGHEHRINKRGGKSAHNRERKKSRNEHDWRKIRTIGQREKNVQKRSALPQRSPARTARRKSLKHASCSLLRPSPLEHI